MATRFNNDSFGTDTEESCCVQAPRYARRKQHHKRWGRLLLLAAAVCVGVPTSGCTMIRGIGKAFNQHEALDEFMVGYRNNAWSARAWLCRKHRFRNHQELADFEAGFRQGYEDIAAGGSGCVPAVCPKAYWGWQYQSADGQRRMNAWFEGYPLGVQAAEEDGIGHWGSVATSFAAPAPCQNCPTGAMLAVPAVPPAGTSGGQAHPERIAPLETIEADQLPLPLYDSITDPRAMPQPLGGPKPIGN
jgi:hypothetical protein